MDVETALREIDEAVHKHVGTEGYDQQREEYRETLEEVDSIGGDDAVNEVVRWLCRDIRAREERPAIGVVDKHAAEILKDMDYDIPLDSRLDPASLRDS